MTTLHATNRGIQHACVRATAFSLVIAALGCARHSLPSTPAERFDYGDLTRFRTALAAVDSGADTVQQMKAYINGGRRGLREWDRRYGLRAERYASAYRAAPQFIKYLATLEPVLRAKEAEITAATTDLQRRASEALGKALPSPPVSYFVTPFGGGGSVQPDVVMIGVDYYGRNPDAPLAEFRRGFFPSGPIPMQSVDGMVVAIAHELTHHYQRVAQGAIAYTRMYRWRRHNTLLARAAREGCAEFVAGLVVGHTTMDQSAYGLPRERALWASFRAQLNEHTDDNPGWFSGRHPEFPDAPWQIGYFVGARMCEAYYRSQPDSVRALRTILGAHRKETQMEMVAAYDVALQARQESADLSSNVAMFETELNELRTSLAIPGLAYVIASDEGLVASNAFGIQRTSGANPFSTSTPLRIASVTKSITGVIALQLAREGRLDLDAPARRYAPHLNIPDNVFVRHLLSHASEGRVGTGYVYSSSRFAMLTDVIEAAAGTGFAQAVRSRILDPAKMRAYVSPTLRAHGGLVSTVDEIGKYLTALERGSLLAPTELVRLALPALTEAGALLPTSFGWFVQTVQGQRVLWSFGQDDPEHSGALLIRLPEHKLSLFLLANSNVLSDPFRLLMGDATKSAFAMSFLRLFAFSPPGAPLSRPEPDAPLLENEIAARELQSPYRFSDELISWALVDVWTNDLSRALVKVRLSHQRYGDSVPDPVLHFASIRLRDSTARARAIRDGYRLLGEQPENRWLLLAQGYLLQQQGRSIEAVETFLRIVNLPNQKMDSLRLLFKAWSWLALAELAAPDDAQQAREYLQRIVSSGITGEPLVQAQRMLEQLGQPPQHQGRVSVPCSNCTDRASR